MKVYWRRLIAFALSFLSSGLGHVYAGRFGRACIAFLLLWLCFVPLIVELPLFMAWGLWSVIGSFIMVLALPFVVHIDAACSVRSDSPGGPLAPRVLVAIVLVILNLGCWAAVPELLVPLLPRRLSKVPSASMAPTILTGDRIISDRRAYRSSPPAPGDIVVFVTAAYPGEEYVKRVVGLPGQSIEVRRGALLLDGVPAEATAGREMLDGRTFGLQVALGDLDCLDWGPERVPEGAVFVLGDNRCASVDSRDHGAVPLENIRGRVIGVQWSRDEEKGLFRWPRFGIDLTGR